MSQSIRSLRTPRDEQLIDAAGKSLARVEDPSHANYLDGRPFVIGGCSKDRDAKRGRMRGGKARGYRLHALVSDDQRILIWAVTAMNEAETTVARMLIEQSPSIAEVLLNDAVFEASPLYDAAA